MMFPERQLSKTVESSYVIPPGSETSRPLKIMTSTTHSFCPVFNNGEGLKMVVIAGHGGTCL
jgi:hypothetical protein